VADVRALTPSEAAEIVVPNRLEVMSELNRAGQRMSSALRERAGRARDRIDAIASRRIFTRPFERVHDFARRLDELGAGIGRRFARRLDNSRRQVDALAQTLDALSPLKVLGRGYSITRRTSDGGVIRDVTGVQPGDQIETVLHRGRLTSRVEATTDDTFSPSPLAGPFDD
jgi:exodeoxyribonuclease VII large subunit